jgi:chromosome segregation ATPase
MEEKMAEAQTNHDAELNAQEHEYAMELENAAKQRQDLMSSHVVELEGAKNELIALKQKYSSDLNQLRGTFSAEKSQAEEVHNTAVETLKDTHSQELRQLQGTHRADFDALKQTHVTELEELTGEHDGEIARVNRQLEETQTSQNDRIRDQEARHISRVADLTSTSSNLRTLHQNASNELTRHRDMLTEAERRIAELTAKNQDWGTKLTTATEQASATANEIAELRQALRDAHEKLATLEQKERLQAKMDFKSTEDLEYKLATMRKEKIALRNDLNVRITIFGFN